MTSLERSEKKGTGPLSPAAKRGKSRVRKGPVPFFSERSKDRRSELRDFNEYAAWMGKGPVRFSDSLSIDMGAAHHEQPELCLVEIADSLEVVEPGAGEGADGHQDLA